MSRPSAEGGDSGPAGASARRLWAYLRRLWTTFWDDAVPDVAAQVAYYLLFSVFPLLFFIVALAPYLPLQRPLEAAMDQLAYLAPQSTVALVRGQLQALLDSPRPKLMTFSLLASLWTASRGVDALRKALNLAYDVTESRSAVKVQLLAVGSTVVTALLVLAGFAMILLGGEAGAWLAAKAGIARQFQAVWSWLRWPTTAAVIMLAAALTYYLLPDVRQRFRYVTPGSVTCTVLWLLATWGFTRYVDSASSFNVAYGSLAGALVLLLWLYIGALVFVLGGEVNATLEHALPSGKRPGARDFGRPRESEGFPVKPGAAKARRSAWRSAMRVLRLKKGLPDEQPPA